MTDNIPARPSEVVSYRVDLQGGQWGEPTYHWTKEEAILTLWARYMQDRMHHSNMETLLNDWDELVAQGSIEDYGIIQENRIPCSNYYMPHGAIAMRYIYPDKE